MDRRIKEIIAKVDHNLARPLSIPELAASVNLSVSHFQRLFKHELHVCPVKYIRRQRLERARDLLTTTHLRVKEIRQRVGLTSETHFQRSFKREFGATPSDYRRDTGGMLETDGK